MDSKQSISSRMMARLYPYRQDPLDAAFCAHARPGMTVLDAGCGGARGCAREAPWQQMHIIGADADPAVMNNPFCNEKVVCNLSTLPFDNESFDLIHCRWVLEHLEDPMKVFREFARVLKPGGRLIALTPNIFHYATISARFTPQSFHRWWCRGQGDTFTTYYHANSVYKLRRLCDEAGLLIQDIELFECPPHYLVRFWPIFLCGVLYERVVNSTTLLKGLRQRILLNAVASHIAKS
jgi:SAM-dependent methyltransferase